MTPETFVNQLATRGLSLSLGDGEKLRLTGQTSATSEKVLSQVRDYIREHKAEILDFLTTVASVARSSAVCYACGIPIDEHSGEWRLTATGTLFCVSCWQSKRLDLLPASVDIEVLTESFLARPCASCGAHNWLLDPEIADDAVARSSGYLICPCLLAKRELARQPRPAVPAPAGTSPAAIRCPHCEKAGKLAYGVANYRKTPGKAFYYVPAGNGLLKCPGCQDTIAATKDGSTSDDLTTTNNNPEFASAYAYIDAYDRGQRTGQAGRVVNEVSSGGLCRKHGLSLKHEAMGTRYCDHADCWERYRLISEGARHGYPALSAVVDPRDYLPDLSATPVRYTESGLPIYPSRPARRQQIIEAGLDAWRDFVSEQDYQAIDRAVKALLR